MTNIRIYCPICRADITGIAAGAEDEDMYGDWDCKCGTSFELYNIAGKVAPQ